MSTDTLLGDIEKGFLQFGIKQEDKDAFCFLFKVKGQEQHFRFTRVPLEQREAHSCKEQPYSISTTNNQR